MTFIESIINGTPLEDAMANAQQFYNRHSHAGWFIHAYEAIDATTIPSAPEPEGAITTTANQSGCADSPCCRDGSGGEGDSTQFASEG